MVRPHALVVLVVLALAAALGAAPRSYAETGPDAFSCESYSGQIAGDTTWSPAECPGGYTITGNVLVKEGITLTVLPGALVRFNATPTLTIEGALVARGTAAQPIVFTSSAASPAAGDWKGIAFKTSSADATFDGAGSYTGGSIIQHATIVYGGDRMAPIALDYAAPYLDQVTIRDSNSSAVAGLIASELRINAATITDNQGHGIDIKTDYDSGGALEVVIAGSTVARNTASGINLFNNGRYQSQGRVLISGSTVEDNGGPGVSINNYRINSANYALDITLSGSTISGNQSTGAYLNGTHVQVVGNTISGNSGANRYPFSNYCVGGLQIGYLYTPFAAPILEGQVRGNTITGNAGYSGYCSGYANTGGLAAEGQLTISGNTISGNTVGGGLTVRAGRPIINGNNLFDNSAGSPAMPRNLTAGPLTEDDPTLDAKNNWWGTAEIAQIEAGIYDYADNTALNEAIYAPPRSGPVYLISGRVATADGRPVPGVTIDAGGGRTATTDAGGDYVLSGLEAGSYTLTPSRANFAFAPASRSLTIGAENLTGQDFVATQTSYSIIGRIVDSTGAPQTSVPVSDDQGHSATTDPDGTFTLSGLSNGSHTITPTRRGYTFTPAARTVEVAGQDVFGVDFTAAIVYYTIAGTVRDGAGSPLAYVRVDAGAGRTEYTGADGTYIFRNLQDNSYTIRPSLSGYEFAPEERVVMVGPSATGVDFVGTDPRNAFVLSGRVVDSGGRPLAGVVVANGKGRTATTNSSGDYRFEKQPRGNYTVTPQLSDHFFNPRSRTVYVSGETGGVNFVGARAAGASLLINHPDGRPGSAFTLVGVGYPAGQTAQVLVNERLLGSVPIDATGGFTLVLATSAQANLGAYTVRIAGGAGLLADGAAAPAVGAAAGFTLSAAAPLRAREDYSSPMITVPRGLGLRIFLPLLRR